MTNSMGPNVLWLADALSEVVELRPGMNVLDLGCGRAVSSIFFAREFGVRVWATDLWIPASENWQRVVEAGCEASVYPIHAEGMMNDHPMEASNSLEAAGGKDVFLQNIMNGAG